MSPTPTDGEVEAAARAVCSNWSLHGLLDGSTCDGSIHVDDARTALQAAYAHPDGTVARLTRERDEAYEHDEQVTTSTGGALRIATTQLYAVTRELDKAHTEGLRWMEYADELKGALDGAETVLREIVRCYEEQDDRMFDRAMAEGIAALAQKDTP